MRAELRRHTAWAIVLSLMASAATSVSHAPPAEAFLYWTDRAHNVVGRANHVTGEANPAFHLALEPMGLGLGPDALFYGYTDSRASNGQVTNAPAIGQIGLAGGTNGGDALEVVNPVGEDYVERVDDVEVVDGRVFWFINNLVGQNRIGRANLDGSGVDQSLVATALDLDGNNTSTGDLAVDANHVYWSSELGPSRARLDGSDVQEPFIPIPAGYTGGYYGLGLAVGGGYVYWSAVDESDDGFISRARLDGSDVDPDFIELPEIPDGDGYTYLAEHLEVDQSHIYVSLGSLIARANIDGSGFDTDFIDLHALGYDQASVLWADADDIEIDAAVGDPGNPPLPVIKRKVTIKAKKTVSSFTGKIISDTRKCRQDGVTVYRRKKGKDPKIVETFSRPAGGWSAVASRVLPAGRYYAVVRKFVPEDERYVCASAKSKTAKRK